MEYIEKTISNLIENQFPEVYRENGENFVEFMKSYYEWMESSNNSIYHSRRLLEYKDVDKTVDDFIIHFKNKYLNSIRFDTAVSTPQILKHSLDIYRSKGTERSLSLFFKSIFGVDASVYYPAKDIFKTSAGVWIRPEYLEMKYSDDLKSFENIQIEGVDSGATAFVERYIKKRSSKGSVYSYLYYITNRVGNFQTGEQIRASSTKAIGPIIIGSATTVDVIDGGVNYDIGDIVYITSNAHGIDAKARVVSTEIVTGKVKFTLVDGGWGYNSNSQIIISNNVLTLSNVVVGNAASGIDLYEQFETVIQPMANIAYNTLSNGSFSVGDTVFRKDTSNNIYAYGTILSVFADSNTSGKLLISSNSTNILSNNYMLIDESNNFLIFQDGYDFETSIPLSSNGNIFDANSGAFANITNIVDQTASANVMKLSSTITIFVSNSVTQFSNNDTLYQMYGNTEVSNGIIDSISYSGTNATIRLRDYKGSFYSNTILSRANTFANGYLDNIIMNIGVYDKINDFVSTNNNILYSSDTQTYAEITKVSHGGNASFTMVNDFENFQEVTFNTDIVKDYYGVTIDSPDYGFPANGAETANSFIGSSLTWFTNSYGTINKLIITNDGSDYDTSPYVTIYEPNLAPYNKKDFIVNIIDATGNFVIGETVSQNNIQRGIVKEGSNSSVLYLKRTTFGDINTLELINGETSFSTGNVSSVVEDGNTLPIGLNAVIVSNAAFANGSVNELEIVNSGTSYYEGEVVTFSIVDPNLTDRTPGSARIHLGKQGRGDGFYKENNSLLSGNKYLQDGNYYQNFSYEIQSSIPLEKYSDVLKNILHIAGTKHFSKFVLSEETDISSSVDNALITIS